jgi:hypothetical protein
MCRTTRVLNSVFQSQIESRRTARPLCGSWSVVDDEQVAIVAGDAGPDADRAPPPVLSDQSFAAVEPCSSTSP